MYEVILNIEEGYKIISIATPNILTEQPNGNMLNCKNVLEVIKLVLSRLGLESSEYDSEEELEPLNYTQYIVDTGFWVAFKLNDVAFLRNTPASVTLFLPATKDVYVHDNIAALINTVLK